MAEAFYDRVNDFGAVKIHLASPNDIRSWSFGEVKKPETINYRTYRPEKDGLFCERIFGPERDYECACGKYKGTKFKGIICDRCGVKVTHSRVRRKRMGHINLAAPIVHIWFFKAIPSHLGNLLGMKTSDLEKVVYFQDYVVTDPGDTPLKPHQVLTEDEYKKTREEYGTEFKAGMGAEAVKELLIQLDLHALNEQLRDDMNNTRSKQKIKDLSKRLKIVEQIRHSENRPEWVIMDVVPVIPPDLRPLVLLESGNFATSDLNDLYRRIINRNNRLKKLMDLNAPEVIIRNEKRMLQQSVDALFDNGRCRRPVLGSSNRPLKSLTDMIKGKQGRFRENLLGKRVDYSARSVIVVGPELKLNQCGLPKKIALELYQPFIIRKLKEHGLVDTIKSAKKMLERRDPEVWDVLEEVIYQHPVLLNRAPTLHRMGIQAFEPVLVEGNAIKIHPLVCTGFNADFDGDQMAVHLPLSVEAQAEAHCLMLSTHNIFSPANGNPIISPSQDIVLGVYYITTMKSEPSKEIVNALVTKRVDLAEEQVEQLRGYKDFKDSTEALLAYDLKKIHIHEPIVVRLPEGRYTDMVLAEKGNPSPIPASGRIVTTVGRLMFNEVLTEGLPYYNCALGKKGCSRVIDDTYARAGRPATIDLLDDMKQIGFKRSTVAGLSFGITDLRIPAKKQEIIDASQKKADRVEKAYMAGAITERERYNQLIDLWTHCRSQVTEELLDELKNDRRDEEGNPLPIAVTTDASDKSVKEVIKNNYVFQFVETGDLSPADQKELVSKLKDAGVQIENEEPTSMELLFVPIQKFLGFISRLLGIGHTNAIDSKFDEAQKVIAGDKWYSAEQRTASVIPDKPGLCFLKRSGTTEVYRGYSKDLRRRFREHYEGNAEASWFFKSVQGQVKEGRQPQGREYLNPVWMMSDSGARGNVSQIQQLAGMRGLMAKPSGEIIETPIRANAREGLSVLEYFSSTHGARKGLADTALKTADSGYLTRKLADVAQNVFVTEPCCGTKRGITKKAIYKGEEVDVPLREHIIGRVARETIRNPITDMLIVKENDLITEDAARQIEDLGVEAVGVRSVLTCESKMGVCANCYGRDLSTGQLVEQGLAVGIIGAQSIGEPGTQLTMRTFHTGGVAHTDVLDTEYRALNVGTVELRDCFEVPAKDEDGNDVLVALKRNGEIAVNDDKGRELEKFKVQYGAFIRVKAGDKVKKNDLLVQWDSHRVPILAEKDGKVKFVDIEIGETVRPESESGASAGKGKKSTGDGTSLVVIEHKGEKHPQIVIEDDAGQILDFHYLPAKARIEVKEGQAVKAGEMLARQPKEASGSADIVGGLPRVTEIFEARKPKDAAVMAEISGKVELRSDKRKGKMTIIVSNEQTALEVEHHVPQDRHLLVHTGDFVNAGDQLIEGPLIPHDILRIKGEESLYVYLIGEVQNVYRAQGVPINDKHIEVIVAQMLRKIRVDVPGDSGLLPNEVVDKFRFREANEMVSNMVRIKDPGETNLPPNALVSKDEVAEANAQAEADGNEPAKVSRAKPATGQTLLLGITKASLQSESFLSGASFQETTKVLTEAALAGKHDDLVGLKENVLLGHLIPVGTGFKAHQSMKVDKLAEPPELESPTRAEDIEDAAALAEAAGAIAPSEIETTVGESSLVAQYLGESDPSNRNR